MCLVFHLLVVSVYIQCNFYNQVYQTEFGKSVEMQKDMVLFWVKACILVIILQKAHGPNCLLCNIRCKMAHPCLSQKDQVRVYFIYIVPDHESCLVWLWAEPCAAYLLIVSCTMPWCMTGIPYLPFRLHLVFHCSCREGRLRIAAQIQNTLRLKLLVFKWTAMILIRACAHQYQRQIWSSNMQVNAGSRHVHALYRWRNWFKWLHRRVYDGLWWYWRAQKIWRRSITDLLASSILHATWVRVKHECATASPDCDSADRWQQSSKKTLFGTCNEMEPALASCRATLVLETLYSYYMVVHTVRAIQHEGGFESSCTTL